MAGFVLSRFVTEKDEEGNEYGMRYICTHDGIYVYEMYRVFHDSFSSTGDILIEFDSRVEIDEAYAHLRETYDDARHISDGDVLALVEFVQPNENGENLAVGVSRLEYKKSNMLHANSHFGVNKFNSEACERFRFPRKGEYDDRPRWSVVMWVTHDLWDNKYAADDIYKHYEEYINSRIHEYEEFHKEDNKDGVVQ